MPSLAEVALIVLRIGIGIIFVNSGLGKFANPAGGIGLVKQLGFIPDPASFISFLRVAELIGGIALILGFRVKYAGALIALFMLANLLVIVAPSVKMVGGYPLITAGAVLKDLAILGGSLALIANPPDRLAIDSKLSRRKGTART